MRKLIYLALAFVFFTSCEKDDPVIPNEEELITTVIYQLTPVGGGGMVEMRYTDLDGDGGDSPLILNGTLQPNTSYTGVLTLLNEQESPAEDITEEIEEEATEHQFFFEPSNASISVAYDDMDSNGEAIGLSSILTTTNSDTAALTITLRHEPNKTATGVSAGDITNAGGETDIEVTFQVYVP